MRNAVLCAGMVMLLVLAGCSNQVNTRPLSRTVAPQTEQPTEAAADASVMVEDESSGQTAAEALQELQEQMASTPATGPKIGTTGMPPAPEGVTGKDALKARTHALYSSGTPVTGSVVADRDFGPISDDLPDDYNNDDSAGE